MNLVAALDLNSLKMVASFILLAGMVDDFITRKVHNWLVLTCIAIGVVTLVVVQDPPSLSQSAFGFLAGIGLMLPLVLTGVLGAGDLKLFTAFALLTGPTTSMYVICYALVWAAAWGVVLVTTRGEWRNFKDNLQNIIFRKAGQMQLQAMPFTVPIFLGWLSYLKLASHGAQIF